MMNGAVLQRTRDSGKCPPSLLTESIHGDGFDEAVLKSLDANAFSLSPDLGIAADFSSLIQMLSGIDRVSASGDDLKKTTLSQRRAVVLAIVGSTPNTSKSLQKILEDGYLSSVNAWLADILNGEAGGIDLLLHLLSSVASLPVDKNIVKASGMGKAIGTLEKHKICVGTPNEAAIKERSQLIKDSWNSSVKAKKALEPKSTAGKAGDKRPTTIESENSGTPDAKRPKLSSSSSVIAKKTGSSPVSGKKPMSLSALAAKSRATSNTASGIKNIPVDPMLEKKETSPKKKSSMRVKWKDHFGGDITQTVLIEGTESAGAVLAGTEAENQSSWNDRKKRDRLREKELLAKAKKSKLIDDEDEDFVVPEPLKTTTTWKTPVPLPPVPDVTPTVPTSPEKTTQMSRMQGIPSVQYLTDAEVPNSPMPLNGNEQALDMTSQSSALVSPIPFFSAAAQEASTPAPAVDPSQPAFQSHATVPAPSHGGGMTATAEYVQRLGLPPFLIGHNTGALDTLANSPGLLQTLIDANGVYDQKRLLDLVQTLTPQGSAPPTAHIAPPQPQHYQPPPTPNMYGAPTQAYVQPPNMYGAPPAAAPRPSFRKSSAEGNLHVSGYGQATTQADIIALFSPYVRVDEVVMKGSFSFVNTSDPENANRAKEVLHGTLLGGTPIRINPAQRKNRDAATSKYGPPSASFPPGQSQYGGGGAMQSGMQQQTYGAPPPTQPAYASGAPPPFGATQLPPPPQMQQQMGMPPVQGGPPPNVDAVRDDRGNPATKNLFVAGYGQGTTEQQLRDVFGQYANVVGVILKGTFSFVNTYDKAQAVTAREMLGNTMLNGGTLRINFAKESGRLGTSFDVTYNQTSGPNARPKPGGDQQPNYYGRGF